MIDYIDLFILYLSLLNFKLTLSSIYIYIPVRLHASSVHSDTHSSFICSLSWFLHLIFSICLFHAFLWSGLAIQTHHTAAPVNFRVFVPAYVHYEMLLYILMEYCTLVSITAWGESLKCPIHQCQTIGMYIWNFNLMYVFLFLQFDLLHILIASALQNLQKSI